MSTKNLVITREGFNQSVSLGDVFMCDNAPYIIIMIISMKRRTSHESVRLEYNIVAQKIDSVNTSVMADVTSFSNAYTVDDLQDIRINNEEPFPKFGNPPSSKYRREDTVVSDDEGIGGVTAIVNNINKIYFRGTELMVDYTCEPVMEWSDSVCKEGFAKVSYEEI